MLYDAHMHTSFSGDCEADPIDMITSAKQKKLFGLTFTDHLDWDFPSVPHFFDLDLDRYLPEMRKIINQFSDEDFMIQVGIELGLQTHLAEQHHKLLSEQSFDFVIGSIHQVDGVDPYYDSYFEGRSIKSAYKEYFDTTLLNVKAFMEFDTLGHLDYICRYGKRFAINHPDIKEDGILSYADFSEVIDEILSLLIKNDKALEVNTAPYRQKFPEPNPSRDILKRYRELGGRLLTIGADAHTPKDIAIGFDGLPALLKECGFDSFYVYKKRRPVEYPLVSEG